MSTESTELSRKEVGQILRYWLTSLRHEEALATRPRARRVGRRRKKLDLVDPGPGQGYFRIDAGEGGADFCLRRRDRVEREMGPAETGCFERWLLESYRAQWSPVEREETWLVGFPAVHFKRSDELAAPLRFRAQVSWRSDDGLEWKVPSRRARRSGKVPEPPVKVRVDTEQHLETERLLPFSVDTHLLNHTLGVPDEALLPFLEALQARDEIDAETMVLATCLLLETGEWPGALPDADAVEAAHDGLFNRLAEAVRTRAADARHPVAAYPTAIVYDASRGAATWHLQRELAELLKHLPGQAPWGTSSALWAYLAGHADPPGWHPHLGSWTPTGLTPDQRAASERFLGSTLTAVQGPPGTGKTELILNLVADGLVNRVRRLAQGGRMGDRLTVVASTNNRAVDNVVEPLSSHLPMERLPLALRVGSQRVTSEATIDLLLRCRQWLAGQDDADAQAQLDDAVAAFDATWDALWAHLQPVSDAHTRQVDQAKLSAELETLDDAEPVNLDAPALEMARRRVRRARSKMERIRRIASRRKPQALADIGEQYVEAKDRALRLLKKSLKTLGVPMPKLPVPPDVEGDVDAHLQAWEVGAEDALDVLEELAFELESFEEKARQQRRRTKLESALADLGEAVEAPPLDPAVIEPLHRRLFEQAVEVRERWAVVHEVPISAALAKAVELLGERASFKRIEDADPDGHAWLVRLFPCIGSTLLSLGNAFPDEALCYDRLIIDEAGQCHPAYALSGLMRCRRALVIGDVHQLEPVVRLGRADDARVQRDAKVTLEPTKLAPYRVVDDLPVSAQSVADRAVSDRPTLRAHFRCQPEIIALSDALCGYGLEVRTKPASLSEQVPALFAPVLFAPVEGQQRRLRGSWYNDGELEAVESLLRVIVGAGVSWSDIAVVTPYVGQLEHLRRRLKAAGAPVDGSDALDAPLLHDGEGLATGTVHRFQGGERRVVLFSTVVTQPRSLRFLDSRVNLVNVAVSRAREHLIVLGHADTLSQGRFTKVLVERGAELVRG